MVKGALVTFVLVSLTVLLVWLVSPYLTTRVLDSQFDAAGWQLSRLSAQRPTRLEWKWSKLEILSNDQLSGITASNIQFRPGIEHKTGLSVVIEQLIITLPFSERQQVLDPVNWLSLYRQYLLLVPERGKINKLLVCTSADDCYALQLVWWQQEDDLVVRLKLTQPATAQIHVLMSADGIEFEMFHGGALFISLLAQAENETSISIRGEMLAVRDAWFDALEHALKLPKGLDLAWQTASIRYHGDLLLQPVDRLQKLVENIEAEIDWTGRWHWQGGALTLNASVPHSASLSLSQDALHMALHPSYKVILQLPGQPQLQLTNQSRLNCLYQSPTDSLGCTGDQVEITGPIGVEDLSLQMLIEQFELKDLLSATPVAAVDLSLKVFDPHQQWLTGGGRIDLLEGEITAVARDMVIAAIPLDSFQLSHSTITGGGHLKTDYQGEVTPFNQWLPEDFSGDLDLQLHTDWQLPLPEDWLAWPLTTDMRIKATGLSTEFDDNHLDGGELDLQLAGWPQLTNSEPAHMRWRSIDVGVPVMQLELDFNLLWDAGSRQIDLQGIALSADTLGGSISSDDLQFNLTEASGSLTVQLQQLDLVQILSLEDEEFHSEGKLIGRIPVKIEKGNVIIENGSVETVAPGGLLQYNPSESVLKLAESSQQMATVLTALKNFHYDSLDAELNFGNDGMLRMDTSLKGTNPDYEQGREIHFNLKVEEDIIALLESLKLSDRLTNQIENRMQ